MKTVYLHIGTHKTESVSMHRFLARSDDMLADQGSLYRKTGRPNTDWSDRYGQPELYWSIVGKRGIENGQVWDKLRREINEGSGQCVVVSAEGSEGCTSEDIRRIVSHLNPHLLCIVVHLRSDERVQVAQ